MGKYTHNSPKLRNAVTDLARTYVESPQHSNHITVKNAYEKLHPELGGDRSSLSTCIGKYLSSVDWAERWADGSYIINADELPS